MKKIYLDYAATTPVDPEVVKAMEPFFFEKFGNPSSPHSIGQDAQKALENSRDILAHFIGARSEEVVFNSGATEGNNHAIIGLARGLRNKGNHIIVSKIEHHSVLEPITFLEKEGFQVTYVSVDETGIVDPADIKKTITDKTILVAVMHASNEIGAIEPIAEIGKVTKEKRIVFLVDAAQTVGHVPVQVNEMNVDLLSLSAHKFYGPQGVGALYVRKGTPIASLLLGGDQERNRRASTHNLPGVVGLAKAIELCRSKMPVEAEFQVKLRNRLLNDVPKNIPGTLVNGPHQKRLPQNAHFSFEGIKGEELLMGLDREGIAASMGSACTSGEMEPSHVLKAIGLSDQLAYGSLRITLGRWTTEEDINMFIEKLAECVKRLRK